MNTKTPQNAGTKPLSITLMVFLISLMRLLKPGYLPYCTPSTLNHLATDSLGGSNPFSVLTGLTTDISILLMVSFWEPIYFPTSETAEQKGRFVGFGESVGDALTLKILTDDT